MKLFKLFLFGFILVFQSAAFCAEVTFTVVSDAHIKSDKTNNSMTQSIKNLLQAKDDINKSGSKFVIFLGDNIDVANKHDLVMFAKISNKIKRPIYAILGNHDTLKTHGLDKKEYYRVLNKYSKNKISKVPSVKKLNGFVFIFMDGTNDTIPSPKGYYREKELIWLEKKLAKYEKDNVIIAQHYPIISAVRRGSRETHNPEPYLKILEKHKNVKAIIAGHFHSDYETEDKNGIKHIGVPALYANNEYKVINIKTLNNITLVKTKTISVE